MTREELVDSLGTIAQSGTAKFMKAMKVGNLCGRVYISLGWSCVPILVYICSSRVF